MGLSRYLAKFGAFVNSGGLLLPAGLHPDGQYVGMKNRLINGNFEFWQRNNTSRTFLGAGNYSADRWCRMGYQDGAHERVAITSPVAGMTSRYAMRVSSSSVAEAAGGSRMDLSQKIENVNCYDLAGQNATVSFWVRFSAATISSSVATAYGNFQMFVKASTASTDASTFSDLGDSHLGTLALTNGSLPTVWTKQKLTVACPSGLKNLATRFEFENLGNTTANSGAWYEVAEVQLEKGDAATSFDYRHYTTEEMLVRRYYQTNARSTGVAVSTNAINVNHVCVPPMRSIPAIALTSATPYIENAPWAAVSTTSGCTASNGHMTIYGGDVMVTGTISGIVANQAVEFGGNQLLFNSEL